MFRKHVTSALLCALPILAAHAAPLSPAEAGLKFIAAFRDCQIRKDVPACSALVANDAVMSWDNGQKQAGREFLRELSEPQEIPRQFSEPEDVYGWRIGDMLFFNYISVRTETYGQQPYRMRYRATMVLRESPTGTQLQLFQATLIPNTLRAPAKMDPAAYDSYVGEYSAGPGDREVVTREGRTLWITMYGSRVELLPGGTDSFYIYGEGDEWFFVRDAKGNVTGLESRLWGQNILAPRVKS
jgi:ketosteroid isomerase-like protein